MPTYTYILPSGSVNGNYNTGITLRRGEKVTNVKTSAWSIIFKDFTSTPIGLSLTSNPIETAESFIQISVSTNWPSSTLSIPHTTEMSEYEHSNLNHLDGCNLVVVFCKDGGRQDFFDGNGTCTGKDTIITITTNEPPYNIVVNNTDNGTAYAGANTALSGTTVTLTATPNTGYQLFRWIAVPTVSISNENTFVMPSNDIEITPVFKVIPSVLQAGHYNGTSYDQCIPMYYDGTNWIECEWKYYNGSNWQNADSQ